MFIHPRENKSNKKIFLALILLLVFFATYYFYQLNRVNSDNPAEKQITIKAGQGSQEISYYLKEQGLIRSPLVFELYVWKKGISSRLQEGQYFLAQNLNIKQVAEILSRGIGSYQEKNLTFIEGWNIGQYAQYLSSQGFGTQSDFLKVVQKKSDWWDQYDFLKDKPRNLDLEGYLFPDTYRVYGNSLPEDIVKKLLDNFGIKLSSELRQEIKRQNKTIHEILTLASIIEKEVSGDQDRKMVADIFYKRLKAGMALQSDATVNYLTGKGTTRPSSNDLQIESLYNTYRYRGLPPGPICNPSLSAIMAAIYPQANSYWYFLTTPDGKVIYSKTYDEHLKAKARYYK